MAQETLTDQERAPVDLARVRSDARRIEPLFRYAHEYRVSTIDVDRDKARAGAQLLGEDVWAMAEEIEQLRATVQRITDYADLVESEDADDQGDDLHSMGRFAECRRVVRDLRELLGQSVDEGGRVPEVGSIWQDRNGRQWIANEYRNDPTGETYMVLAPVDLMGVAPYGDEVDRVEAIEKRYGPLTLVNQARGKGTSDE